jgi:16S rRNA (cytosine967-C5)-methyltransferase
VGRPLSWTEADALVAQAPQSADARPATPTIRRSRATPARIAAALALVDTEAGAFLDEALSRHAPSDPRERAHAWFLALGATQRRGQVDAALREVVERPIDSLDPILRAVLRAGAFEKLFGRAGDHAVVDQGVEVARALGLARASGLANAVLRRVRAASHLAAHEALDHPAWLVARWTERYGAEATQAWCARNNEPAPLTVALRGPDPDLIAAWEARGLQVDPARTTAGPVADAVTLRGHDGPIDALPGYDRGAFWVQDAAAIAISDLIGAKPGMRVLDACASPGGKALRLAAAGAQVVAVDRADRLDRLAESVRRVGLDVEIVAHDWEEGPCPALGRDFDAVLIDAPCTGLGTVRRHPEIRWRRQPADLARAAERQLRILDAASAHARPDGRVLYAVCSPEPEEGEAVVRTWLLAHPDRALVRAWSSAPPGADEDAHQGFVVR